MGDFSGYHKAVYDVGVANESVNHIELISSGDGWKQISGASLDLSRKGSGVLSILVKLLNIIKLYFSIPKSLDVVQLINPVFITESSLINYLFFRKFRKRANKVILISCGTDAIVWREDQKRRYSFATNQREAAPGKRFIWETKCRKWLTDYVATHVDHIVPALYEYANAYKDSAIVTPVIALPCPLSEYTRIDEHITRLQNSAYTDDALTFYHGVTRADFKGSLYIEGGFKLAKASLANKVNLIYAEKLPYDEYKEALRKTDVIVDQCLSYSYGMNTIIALSEGKICFSGNEPEFRDCLNIKTSPIVNIVPEPEQIHQAITQVANLSAEELRELKLCGMEYVKENHNPYDIFNQLFDVWTK